MTTDPIINQRLTELRALAADRDLPLHLSLHMLQACYQRGMTKDFAKAAAGLSLVEISMGAEVR